MQLKGKLCSTFTNIEHPTPENVLSFEMGRKKRIETLS